VAVPVQAGEIWCIKRPDGLRHHAREIAFPGGKPELADPDLQAAALRELWEELGIAAGDVTVLGALTPVPTATSRFAVHPFWVAVADGAQPRPAPGEVAALIRTPIGHFFDGTVPYRAVDLGEYESPIFDFDEGSMYGASAHVLLEALEIYAAVAGESLPQPVLTTSIPWA
jgi:8-oxo-dGTP pyrophosphatase MutT (NUDIX family)